MTNVIKNSLLIKSCVWIKRKWRKSLIGWYFTRNLNDVKIKNSKTYEAAIYILNAANKVTDKFSDITDKLISGSALISFFCTIGNNAARIFKGSLLCRLIEKVLECEFDFAGVKLYQLIVFLIAFIAPIAPTMVNAGLAVIALFLYIIDCIRFKNVPKKLDGVSFLLTLLIAIFGFFAVFSLTPKNSIKIWFLYTVFMLFFFLITGTVTSKDKLYKLAAVMAFSGFLVALYGVYQNFFGNNLEHAWLDNSMFGDIAVRVYSTLENPNVLGEYLLLIIPVCAALLWTRKTILSKLYYLGILGILFLCMVFTQSRGCWLGLILTAAVFALFVDWRLVVFGIIVLFILPFVLPDSIIARFQSIGNVNDSSTSYRLYIWLGTLNMLRDFGIYGIGLGSDAFNKIYPFYSYSSINAPHAHNIYLQLLCETGIVGLGVFLLFVIISLKKMLLTVLSEKKGFTAVFSVSIIAGITGFMLQGAFDYVWYNYRVFLIFWMVIALGIAARRVKDDKANSCY